MPELPGIHKDVSGSQPTTYPPVFDLIQPTYLGRCMGVAERRDELVTGTIEILFLIKQNRPIIQQRRIRLQQKWSVYLEQVSPAHSYSGHCCCLAPLSGAENFLKSQDENVVTRENSMRHSNCWRLRRDAQAAGGLRRGIASSEGRGCP